MIEPMKPLGDEISNALENRPARLKRELELKEKIGAIIQDHPNKSVNVIRRWLHDDEN